MSSRGFKGSSPSYRLTSKRPSAPLARALLSKLAREDVCSRPDPVHPACLSSIHIVRPLRRNLLSRNSPSVEAGQAHAVVG
jgi:hypothetical protein